MVTRSVTRAAEELRTSQPTASRFLAELEREIGFLLFVRRRNKLEPTPEAFAFYEEVQQSFIGLRRLASVAENIANFRSEVIRIAAIPSVGFGVLPHVITPFRRAFPDVQIALDVLTFEEVVRNVAARQCELGFVAYPVERPGLSESMLLTTSAVCVLPSGHPLAERTRISARDLVGEPLISTGTVAPSRKRVDAAFAAAAVKPNIVLETQTGGLACALVKAGAGIAVLEPLSAMTLLDRQIVVRPFAPTIPFEFRALTRNDRPAARVAIRFLDIARDVLKALPDNDTFPNVAWKVHEPDLTIEWH